MRRTLGIIGSISLCPRIIVCVTIIGSPCGIVGFSVSGSDILAIARICILGIAYRSIITHGSLRAAAFGSAMEASVISYLIFFFLTHFTEFGAKVRKRNEIQNKNAIF